MLGKLGSLLLAVRRTLFVKSHKVGMMLAITGLGSGSRRTGWGMVETEKCAT